MLLVTIFHVAITRCYDVEDSDFIDFAKKKRKKISTQLGFYFSSKLFKGLVPKVKLDKIIFHF